MYKIANIRNLGALTSWNISRNSLCYYTRSVCLRRYIHGIISEIVNRTGPWGSTYMQYSHSREKCESSCCPSPPFMELDDSLLCLNSHLLDHILIHFNSVHTLTARRGKAVTLQLHIRELSGSNLRPDIGYSDKGVSWFSSVRDSGLKLGHDRFIPNNFQFIIRLLPFHSTLCSLSYRRSVVK
jgi:hypothetical protein